MARLSTIDYKDDVLNFLKELNNGEPMIIFDLETTGLSAITDRILSCSAIKYKWINNIFEEIDRIDVFIDPEFEIPQGASDVNGITNEMLINAPNEKEAFEIINNFFGEKPLVAGYNSLSFDQKFMDSMYLRWWGEEFEPKLHLDVFKMAKEKLPLKKHTLENVSKELGADINLSFHRSIDDVIATARVFQTLYPHYTVDDINTNPSRKLKVINLKHWDMGHKVNRLYVNTDPFIKGICYDIYKKEWLSETDEVDLKDIQKQVLNLYEVSDIKELIKNIKKDEAL